MGEKPGGLSSPQTTAISLRCLCCWDRPYCREVEKPLYAGVRVIGPAPYPVVRVNMRYRYRITVAGKNDKTLRSLIAAYLVAFSQQKENRELHLFADCNLMD